jgi:hypothetical protein
MNETTFRELVDKNHEERMEVMCGKGEAYSGKSNRFNNFERNGERLGLSKYQIWAVYFSKHIDAIMNAIKDNPENPVDKTEGLKGRIQDAQNYLDLLNGMTSNVDIRPGGLANHIDDAQRVYAKLLEVCNPTEAAKLAESATGIAKEDFLEDDAFLDEVPGSEKFPRCIYVHPAFVEGLTERLSKLGHTFTVLKDPDSHTFTEYLKGDSLKIQRILKTSTDPKTQWLSLPKRFFLYPRKS